MKISQREARRMRRRVGELEELINRQRRHWSGEYVGGVNIGSVQWNADQPIPVAVRTARKLGHAVVVNATDNGAIYFYALPLEKA